MVENKYPSRDLTFEWGRLAPEQLSREADSLDTKIIGIFASSTIIIGVIVAMKPHLYWGLNIIPFIIASISFLVIFGLSLWILRPQLLYVTDSPIILEEDYWKREAEEAKKFYWENLKDNFINNLKIVRSKGRILQYIVPILGLETITLLIWLLL